MLFRIKLNKKYKFIYMIKKIIDYKNIDISEIINDDNIKNINAY